ncbi:hypothetical protein [Micromonospora sp. NPDC005707]|uniref:hypothetical protein n=1 Tax=Micromonospora sp. NPDC005707 TaxID=3157050 RepID=UPI0033C3C37D
MSDPVTTAASGFRPYAVAGAPLLCDARDHGLTGDGTTNDQPALAALVDLIDQHANWPPDGHRGKVLRVGSRYAVVAANDATTLTLSPNRPGINSSWSADTPQPKTPYELPAAPTGRGGITINATSDSVTIRGNLIRDTSSGTQLYGIWITERGSCLNCRVVENDLDGNRTAIKADTPAIGGHWAGNHGDQ